MFSGSDCPHFPGPTHTQTKRHTPLPRGATTSQRLTPPGCAGNRHRAARRTHPHSGVIQLDPAYGLNRAVGETHSVACPSALIGASNFFELAVAAAISLFGFHSGAALATVVGVLIEVPVMLLVVGVVNRSKGWYENPATP